MGSVRKRGARWRAEVRRKGVYQSKEFRTKSAADAWLVHVEAKVSAGIKSDFDKGRSLAEALDKYRSEVSLTKRGARWESIRLVKMRRDLGACAHLPISEIRAQDIAAWRDRRLLAVSPASVNREWNLLRSVFSIARREWGWLTDNPMKDVSRPPGTKPRRRRVNEEELAVITRCAGIADGEPVTNHSHRVALAFELAIETGMRAGEIRTLEPEQIDLVAGVARLLLTKNGDSRDVPLSSRARELIRRLLRPQGPLLPMSAGVMDSTFRRLRQRARIEDLHFHDSRAEAATRLSRIVDVLTLARILGHRDIKSLMVYYRESAEDIAKRLG